MSIATLKSLLDAAEIPYAQIIITPGPGADALSIAYQPEASPEQVAAGNAILTTDYPSNVAAAKQAEASRLQSITNAAAAGCPITLEGKTIVFGVTVGDYTALMADLGAMGVLDADGDPEAPEALMDIHEHIHTLPTRALAKSFLKAYRSQVKPAWAGAWPPAPS
ncbi:hypothetical protein DB346_03050 [Verrucomicrobia bacterium LW23]|nr:hypothetical protein DB346_03605 [Verrucomicrobia bacterium LW23]PTY04427.1 hypothetical protein DB346_03050 [Verrucomicrobia bacterium LW23]